MEDELCRRKELISQLFDVGAVKLGNFHLKSGIISPIYFDFRSIISHPGILKRSAESVWQLLQPLTYDTICGVPYTALPIACCVAVTHELPMLLKRKETKDYGTKKIIEGAYKRGQRCVIIEDVVTSGSSILETAASLKNEGLEVTDAIVLLNREQGGRENLAKNGITLHSVLTVDQFLGSLEDLKKISAAEVADIRLFISDNQLASTTDPLVDQIEKIVLRLHDIGAFRFGSFKLSNGMITPIYVDLRLVMSHPVLMSDICKELYKLVEQEVQFDLLCGVPYAALHLATCIGKDHNLSSVLLRKTAKSYGTGKLIEGSYKPGQRCLVVEDVMVSGQGIYEAVESLKSQGLQATDALLVLDREQNGEKNLGDLGVKLHCLIRITDALDILHKHKRIDSDIASEVKLFLRNNPAKIPISKKQTDERTSQINELLPFDERARRCSNPISVRLLEIMSGKSTNLCVSADVTSCAQLLDLADKVGPYICMLKIHHDILEDFSTDSVTQLTRLSNQHNFIIFEDRKYADIGATVVQQYGGGVGKVADWAHITTAHTLAGGGTVAGLKQVGLAKQRACVLVAEMSSSGNLCNATYAVATVNMALEHRDFVIGFISQSKLTSDPTLLHMTPGVKLNGGSDCLGQQYVTPLDAVTLRGADIIIVGRGITEALDVVEAAQTYQMEGYSAYEKVRSQQRSDR